MMDIGTIVGMLVSFALVVGSVLVAGASLGAFVDVPSLLIVGGGTICACLVAFPISDVLKFFKVSKKALFSKPADPVANILALIRLAEVARRDGILSLEAQLDQGNYDEFLARGIRMAIDGQDPANIQAAMEQEIETMMERHGAGKSLYDCVGKYGPAYGMLGTLIGLVIMLGNLSDPKTIGPAMAVALITTFYGSVVANMLAGPVADKLALRSSEEVANRIIVLRGVMSIQAGDNPRIVQQKLMSFLNAKQRAQLEAALANPT